MTRHRTQLPFFVAPVSCKERLLATGFHASETCDVVGRAYHAVHALAVRMHYESCRPGVGAPPKDEGKRVFKSSGTCGTLRRVNMQRKHHPRKAERHASLFARVWGLFFATNDRFITYQQRRNWRARASFFFVLGVVLTLVVIWFLQGRGLVVIHLAK